MLPSPIAISLAFFTTELARLLHHRTLLVLEDLHDLLGDAAILESRDLSVEELLEVVPLGLLGLCRELTLGLRHRVIELLRVGLSQEGDQLPDQLIRAQLSHRSFLLCLGLACPP
ncbi:MAG: hypothetical protein HYS74_01655 [Parcubacteria group bacterium]|nr:hypothetical protein [Parcubacteria group bacterium]